MSDGLIITCFLIVAFILSGGSWFIWQHEKDIRSLRRVIHYDSINTIQDLRVGKIDAGKLNSTSAITPEICACQPGDEDDCTESRCPRVEDARTAATLGEVSRTVSSGDDGGAEGAYGIWPGSATPQADDGAEPHADPRGFDSEWFGTADQPGISRSGPRSYGPGDGSRIRGLGGGTEVPNLGADRSDGGNTEAHGSSPEPEAETGYEVRPQWSPED